jgi:molybdopterin molybdotransferase
VRIFTGAPLPVGCDAVIAQEDVRRAGDQIVIDRLPAKFGVGRHVRQAGIDFREGDRLLLAGHRLSARDVGLTAAMNCARVVVHRRPRVAVVSTGNELVAPGATPGRNQIVDCSGPAICALIAARGGLPVHLGIARDEIDALRAIIDASGIDLLVTIGGVSVGDHDVVLAALGQFGLRIDFHGVAMRPGKPVTWGHVGDRGLLCLPGNPVSAAICALLFLHPALDRLQGIAVEGLETEIAPAGCSFPPAVRHHRFLQGQLRPGPSGVASVVPSAVQDTSVLSTFAAADCVIVQQPSEAVIDTGAPVQIIRLANRAVAI